MRTGAHFTKLRSGAQGLYPKLFVDYALIIDGFIHEHQFKHVYNHYVSLFQVRVYVLTTSFRMTVQRARAAAP